MVIMGIDPGYGTTGWAFIETDKNKKRVLDYGVITTQPHTPLGQRLVQIEGALEQLLALYRPTCVSMEKLYFNTNTTTAIAVAEARGVMLLVIARHGLPLHEFTPLQIKQAVVGYGMAEKRQVQFMVRVTLGLKETPKPDDAADAIAAALCLANVSKQL